MPQNKVKLLFKKYGLPDLKAKQEDRDLKGL